MRTTPAKDLRVTKTLEAIDTTFRAMMLESGFSSITVKALCERAETVPEGWKPERWHVFYAYQSAATLAMYRAWVADGKAIPVEEMADLAARLVCDGARAAAGQG